MVDNEAKNIFWDLNRDRKRNSGKIDAVSHLIRRQSDDNPGKAVFVNKQNAESWISDPAVVIEGPDVQARKLILWLGKQAEASMDPAAYITAGRESLASIIGSRNNSTSTSYIVRGLLSEGLIEVDRGSMAGFSGQLTFRGWERFGELQRSPHLSRTAFMAMQFLDERLDGVYKDCWIPAVEDAGFELRRLIDGQGAGLIDDQLRVRIRTSKFLIADLSSGNKGAYWEAGFAEGLGRPVIYVCEKKIWESPDKNIKPHFDTSHLNTVFWEEGKLDDARTRLANMIRNTFPAEAKF